MAFKKSVRHSKRMQALIFVGLFIVVGTVFYFVSKASVPTASLEPESGIKTAQATTVTDANASNGQAVQFKAAASSGPGTSNCTTYAAPITITTGGTYSGVCWQSTNAAIPAVLVATSQPVVIQNCTVKGPGTLIRVQSGQANADVTVRGCYGEGTSATNESRFVVFDSGWKRAIIENNYMVRTAGSYYASATPTEVKIRYNKAKDIVTGGTYYVQFAQFDKVNGGDVELGWNEVINTPGQSNVEDNISIYASGGTRAKRWTIHDNLIWGAFPNPITGTYSGGGIMHGDNSGGWVETYGNAVLGTTNYGIAIAGGTGFYIHDNTVVSCGCTSSGTPITSSNVGMYMWSASSTVTDSTMTNNKVGWWRAAQQVRNDFWFPAAGANGSTAAGNTQVSGTAIAYSAEQAEYATWQQRASSGGIHVGP